MKRVVITGLGAITPIGNDLATFWEHLLEGRSGAATITRFDPEPFKTRFACEVKDFDPLAHFSRKESRKLDRFTQFGLIAAEEAVRDSGIDLGTFDPSRAGVIFGSGIGGFETFEQEFQAHARQDSRHQFSPFFITRIIPNSLAGYISIRFGLRGVNYCPVTACATSLQSIIQAFNYIRLDKADLIVAGGSEAPITESSIGGFNAMKALSTNNDDPASASRPFDVTRDGFVVGEGAGALVVESLDSARSRNARIYAEIAGGGENSDAFHIVGTHPEGEGAFLAMGNALREAGIGIEEIDHINAHATSTGVGDLSEMVAIRRLFGPELPRIPICATKSMTGHLLGGTGAVEAIATCLSVQSGWIPPTINTTRIDPELPQACNYNLAQKSRQDIRYALSNSFGFGGHCAALVLKRYEQD